jgi:CheY-like chemotaxis protein
VPGKNVLVVEDNSVEREGLSAILQQEGYNVIAAANGKEAIARWQGLPTPDVMLLDMMMSEGDGWQLLAPFRRDPTLASIPIIIMTGLEIASQEWSRSLGAAGLVRKPIDVPQLLEELARVLGTGMVRIPLPDQTTTPP